MAEVKNKITGHELEERLKWSFEAKVRWAQYKAIEYHAHFRGATYVSFSGGKDSQVLLHLVRSAITAAAAYMDKNHKGIALWDHLDSLQEVELLLFERGLYDFVYTYWESAGEIDPNSVPAVFCDTGLEFSEIRSHVRAFGNVEWVRPDRKFPEVIKTEGIAYPSKKVALMLRVVKTPTDKNEATIKLYTTGIKRDGTKTSHFKIPKKYLHLLDAPFEVSEKCCDEFKKKPWKKYEKRTGRKGYSGAMTIESRSRRGSYLQTGCNAFGAKAISKPISIWTNEDVWAYAALHDFKFCELYYDREYTITWNAEETTITLPAERTTGCTFCMFGIERERKIMNRFQRLYVIDNRKWNYLINKIGFKEVLEYLQIQYLPTDDQIQYLRKDRVMQTDLFGNETQPMRIT